MRCSDDFRQTVRSRRKHGKSTMVVYVFEESERVTPLVGFVVSKSVGNAVVRNKVKRKMRNIVRTHLNELPPAIKMVIRLSPRATTKTYVELERDFLKILSGDLMMHSDGQSK